MTVIFFSFRYVTMKEFATAEVAKQSSAAAALCTWVHAIYVYANVAKEVAPKRARLKEAMDGLASKQSLLKVPGGGGGKEETKHG
jgi:dynein heavy chain, axonemal